MSYFYDSSEVKRREIAPGVTATLFPVPGKVPLYLEGEEVVTDLEGDQTVGVEVLSPEGGVDHIGGSVETLSRSEDLAPEAVGDHEVIANVQTIHWSCLQAAPGRGQGWP